ncbi:hypothetical protein BKA56DRAFT_41777 [Ilyonectria sp. MPI-CAGE-AT-0026]|nr:hypothetical protein BKA56DRAFT_41777 [Ilyonectria sp. MPI-CAGE-AT-0026]
MRPAAQTHNWQSQPPLPVVGLIDAGRERSRPLGSPLKRGFRQPNRQQTRSSREIQSSDQTPTRNNCPSSRSWPGFDSISTLERSSDSQIDPN